MLGFRVQGLQYNDNLLGVGGSRELGIPSVYRDMLPNSLLTISWIRFRGFRFRDEW